MNTKKILAVLSFLLIAIFLVGCNPEDQVLTPDDLSLQKKLTTDEAEGVIQMIWSEKLACDVYTAFFGVSGDELAQFSTIIVSEQQHMDRLIYMLTTHSEYSDPTTEPFPDAFQALYNDYIEYPDPLVACLEIEQTLIDDYIYYTDLEAPVVVHPSLLNLYNSLLDGSEKHFEAFTK